jgi:hydroxyacylglutathione hydrolase
VAGLATSTFPVWCHVAERRDAEGGAGLRYLDLAQLNPLARRVLPRLWKRWDAGPVTIARTVEEGESVAGFQVVHLPGHAPGMIALWRPADGLVLSSDCFFTINIETARKGAVRQPPGVLTEDCEQARESMRKLAALEPRRAWPAHGDPVVGAVATQMRGAAG